MSVLSCLSTAVSSSALQEVILDGLLHPVLVLNSDAEVIYGNASAAACFGPYLIGSDLNALFPACPDAIACLHARRTTFEVISETAGRFSVFASVSSDGDSILSLIPVVSDVRSIVETDELTGLIKRNGLRGFLEQAFAPKGGEGGLVAVHFLDLDRFKVVNDTLGHTIGDQLLKKVAERLLSVCRKQDCVARLGGDEFVIVQSGVTDLADAERLAARLVDLVGRTYVLSGHAVNIGVSVGIAMAERNQAPRDLLRNGDLALYEAKRAGRGRFRVFEPGMYAALRLRRELEVDLRRALALRQFDLHYQPFLDLETNRIIGYEALIRWEHPTRGCVSPADFIPLAEETGLINKIGEWVMRTACATAMSWSEDMTVAVNVSPIQFKADGLVQTVLSALAFSGLSPHRLEIEITEGAFLEDTPNVLKTLHALRDLGVKISMDDFGTGYSSLSYLQKFPFDKIKIDQSFIQASAGGDGEAILKAIASLGLSLGMAITAEGVETAEQLARIRGENCTHVQGYYTGRPQPADRISTTIETEAAGD
ncbi:MAG: hypothetical protein JWN07_3009 [Hyphomicrobiales bacterium]|nr:hypothetical protein [Hyphomicrobiales bacterium]